VSAAGARLRLACHFTLTDDETRKIASRRAFRAAMGGLSPVRRNAPLAVFVGLMAVAVGLALAGIVARRSAEIAILLLVIAYALARSAANLQLRRAYRDERRRAEALGRSGDLRFEADEGGVTLAAAAPIDALAFADCTEADEADDMLYFWGQGGRAISVPTRVLPPGEAQRLKALVPGRRA
jgi:hypothetical protein